MWRCYNDNRWRVAGELQEMRRRDTCPKEHIMGLMDRLRRPGTMRAPKLLIYGPPGSGKTTFALRGPSVVLDTENGDPRLSEGIAGKELSGSFSPYLTRWQDIRECLDELLAIEHQYKLVVIDTIDWALRRIEEDVAGSGNNVEQTLQRSHGGYGNGKLIMRNHVYQQLLPRLDQLSQRGIAILLLAHARLANISDEGVALKRNEGVSSVKAAPDLPDGFLEIFVEWADLVGYISRDGGSRSLIVDDQPRVLAKNRLGLSGCIPLEWSAIMKARKGDV